MADGRGERWSAGVACPRGVNLCNGSAVGGAAGKGVCPRGAKLRADCCVALGPALAGLRPADEAEDAAGLYPRGICLVSGGRSETGAAWDLYSRGTCLQTWLGVRCGGSGSGSSSSSSS